MKTTKGHFGGTCYTPECTEVARQIPIMDPQLVPGEPGARYRCPSCCDTLAGLMYRVVPVLYSTLPLKSPERLAFNAEAVRFLGLTRNALAAELAAKGAPCWNDVCILSACDGEHHGDATGYTWRQRRGESYCPVHTTYDTCVATYPRIDASGRTVWACCESRIGGPCAHMC